MVHDPGRRPASGLFETMVVPGVIVKTELSIARRPTLVD
jgi:hypothetical protein